MPQGPATFIDEATRADKPPVAPDLSLAGRRATVLGLGRHGGGVAAVRFLASLGAKVTVTDLAGDAELRPFSNARSDIALAALHLRWTCPRRFSRRDVVVVNPAVRPDNGFAEFARAAGATITSEIELLLERVPSPVIGVTGSNGKSTTAAMIAAIVSAAGRRVWLGGNIERSLLPNLAEITADDLVVLELSSFQLAWLSESASLPSIGVITNCTPNHLDWHPHLAHYTASKHRLLALPPGITWREIEDARQPAVVLGASLFDLWGPGTERYVVPPVALDRLPARESAGRPQPAQRGLRRRRGACGRL